MPTPLFLRPLGESPAVSPSEWQAALAQVRDLFRDKRASRSRKFDRASLQRPALARDPD